MGYGLTNHLLALCGGVFGVSLLIASRRLPTSWAITLAAVRVFFPLIYFAWYFDGQWVVLDDLEYTNHGEILVEQGYTPLSLLHAESRETLHTLAGGRHILFSWWNLVVMWLFGAYYYVPVVVNISITFLCAHLIAELAAELRFSVPYQRMLHVFYLLHWDTIAWSSFVNLKDMIVQLMTVAFFLSAVRAARRRRWRDVAPCGLLILGFLHLRFYIPFAIGAAAAAWLFLEWRDVRKYPLLAGGLVVGLWLLPGRGYRLLESLAPFDCMYGIIRFALTPQPWSIQDSYSYLMLPATFHWLMFLPAMAGGLMLWRESHEMRLILLYSSLMIVFYSLADELQGARQRSQLSYVFAWAQMHFLWRWTHTTAQKSVPSMHRRPQVQWLSGRAA
jgi:hypothetical protein